MDNQLWYIYTEYWIRLKKYGKSRSPAQNTRVCDSTYMTVLNKAIDMETRSVVFRGWGLGRRGAIQGYRGNFQSDGILYLHCSVILLYIAIKTHRTALQKANFTLCILSVIYFT